MRRLRWIEELAQDLRYAGRQFRKNPGFTSVVTLILALAMRQLGDLQRGAHGLHAADDSGCRSTVMVWTETPRATGISFPASMPDVREWQASGVFASLGAFTEDGFNLRLGDRTERVEGLRTTDGFFEALSIAAARGRTFAVADIATDRVVVLGDRLWRTTFDGNPDIVGQTVVLDGAVHTIIGVLQPTFPRFGHEDLYAPLPAATRLATDRAHEVSASSADCSGG